ncbi:uncharacterized protein [Atheta coriaria]|uniref:uncharacterized protein isoform X2 n=1 Tax=Dalotia coriaria TaxID=877792 RepID=UPI0031F46121
MVLVKPAEIPVYNMIHETQPEEPELDLSELAEVMNPEIDYQSSEEQPIIIDYESSEEEPIIIDAAGHEHQPPVHKPACCPVHTPVEVPMIPSDASEERDAYISEDRPPIDFEQIGDHVVVMPEHLLPAKVPHCS